MQSGTRHLYFMDNADSSPIASDAPAIPEKPSRSSSAVLAADIWLSAAYSFRDVRREFGWVSAVVSALRPMRALLVLFATRRLLQSPAYLTLARDTFAKPLLHFCSAKHYLRKNISLTQRASIAQAHADAEQRLFNEHFLSRIYSDRHLELWRHSHEGRTHRVILNLAGRRLPEGDLQLTFLVDNEPLHKIGFTWIDGSNDRETTAFIARNQGRWRKDSWVLSAYNEAFPQNSAMMFTYAALQGILLAIGCSRVFGVRTEQQIAHKSNSPSSFANSYSEFWKKLGGIDQPDQIGISIPVPFFLTPLEDVASKHRRRAIQRRAHWKSIEVSARDVMTACLRGSQGQLN